MKPCRYGWILCLIVLVLTSCSQPLSEPVDQPIITKTAVGSKPSPVPPTVVAETSTSFPEESTQKPDPSDTPRPIKRLNPEDVQGEILCSIYPDGDIAIVLSDGSEKTILLDMAGNMGINDNRHGNWLPGGNGYSYTVDDFITAEIWIRDNFEEPGRMLLGDVATNSAHAWSPDGRSLAYVATTNQIFIYNLDTQTSSAVTDDQFRSATDPAWSPDGTQIAFSGSVGGRTDIYLISIDGPELIPLTDHPGSDQSPAWSPNGSKIIFSSTRDGDHIKDIYMIDLNKGSEGDGNVPWQLTFDETMDINPDWSPDGQFIVYASHTLGAAHATLFIIDQDGTSRFQLTKKNTYHYPKWRP
jgi:WD40 repeat protein